MSLSALLESAKYIAKRSRENKLEAYKPYPKQVEFHNAIGKDTDTPAKQRMLFGGNQVGKSWCGSMECAIHATGLYPDWWKGTRYRHPLDLLVAESLSTNTKAPTAS